MKRFLLIVILCLIVLAGPASAQDVPSASGDTSSLSELEIALWPEFDQPEVLVIYRGLFAPDTVLPVPVEIRIPADVGQPTAVAYVGEAGQRFNQEYTTRVEGDELVVAFDLGVLGFQLEYYDTLPVDSAGQRQYTYAYAADYPVMALRLEFQVPPSAEGFRLDPAADSVVQESDGLTYHLVEAGPMAQGQPRSWTFFYQKDNSDLTASAFTSPGEPTPPAPAVAAGADNSAVLIFLVAFVALVGVGAGAFWLGRRAQSIPQTEPLPTKPSKRRGSGRSSKPERPPASPSPRQEKLFCYKCGVPLRTDADFCHSCGAAVHR
jgi:hypothetical protein